MFTVGSKMHCLIGKPWKFLLGSLLGPAGEKNSRIFFCGFFFFLATMLFVDSKLAGLLVLSLDEVRVLTAGAMAEMKKGCLAKKKVERTCCCEGKGLQLTKVASFENVHDQLMYWLTGLAAKYC